MTSFFTDVLKSITSSNESVVAVPSPAVVSNRRAHQRMKSIVLEENVPAATLMSVQEVKSRAPQQKRQSSSQRQSARTSLTESLTQSIRDAIHVGIQQQQQQQQQQQKVVNEVIAPQQVVQKTHQTNENRQEEKEQSPPPIVAADTSTPVVTTNTETIQPPPPSKVHQQRNKMRAALQRFDAILRLQSGIVDVPEDPDDDSQGLNIHEEDGTTEKTHRAECYPLTIQQSHSLSIDFDDRLLKFILKREAEEAASKQAVIDEKIREKECARIAVLQKGKTAASELELQMAKVKAEQDALLEMKQWKENVLKPGVQKNAAHRRQMSMAIMSSNAATQKPSCSSVSSASSSSSSKLPPSSSTKIHITATTSNAQLPHRRTKSAMMTPTPFDLTKIRSALAMEEGAKDWGKLVAEEEAAEAEAEEKPEEVGSEPIILKIHNDQAQYDSKEDEEEAVNFSSPSSSPDSSPSIFDPNPLLSLLSRGYDFTLYSSFGTVSALPKRVYVWAEFHRTSKFDRHDLSSLLSDSYIYTYDRDSSLASHDDDQTRDGNGRTRVKEQSFPFSQIEAVLLGKCTKSLLSVQCMNIPQERCFAFGNRGSMISLLAQSKNVRDEWTNALRLLIHQAKMEQHQHQHRQTTESK